MEILRRYCFNRTTMSRGNKGWNSSNPTKRRRRRNKVWQEFSNFENGVIGCEELRIILFRPESPPKHRMGCFAFIRASWSREREKERRQRFLSSRWRKWRVVRVKTNAIRCVQVVWESVLLETSAKRGRRKLDSFFIA